MAEDRKRKLYRLAMAILGVIVVALIFNKILDRWSSVRTAFNTCLSAATPILAGAVIAFLLNPILVFFDRLWHTILQDRVIKDKKKLFKVSRGLSVLFTMVLFLGAITGLLYMVIPQLYDSIKTLVDNMPGYYENVNNFVQGLYDKFTRINIDEDKVQQALDMIYKKLTDWVNTDIVPNLDKVVLNISSGVIGGLKFLYNFLIGIIASIYIMCNKEYLASRGKKVVYATFKKVENANLLLDGISCVNNVFGKFLNGKILDSIIIGIMTFAITYVIDMPYAVLISVVIGVTNIIPFFGPIIGAIPCVLIVLIADPLMSLVLLIIILILQQFDGNILGPKILGDSTGLTSFWVLTAVIVGGGIFGFAGMLLGVPVFACCYMYINRFCTMRLKNRGLSERSCDYEKIKRLDNETGEPIYKTEEEEDIRFKKKTPEEKEKLRLEKLAKKKHHLGSFGALRVNKFGHDDDDKDVLAAGLEENFTAIENAEKVVDSENTGKNARGANSRKKKK